MPNPPIPQPRYINSDIVLVGLGQVINIYDSAPPTPSGMISIDEINTIIAQSESEVEMDLNTWWQVPFVTNTTPPQDWTNLPDPTYDYLFRTFKAKSQYNIYRQYFGTTDENKGNDFWTSQLSLYNEMLKRLYKLDQTNTYLYQVLPGMALNPIGIKRALGRSNIGLLGGKSTANAAYAINNITRPFIGYC